MVNHELAKQMLINGLENKKSELELLISGGNDDFTNNRIEILKVEVESLESSLQLFVHVTTKAIKFKNDKLRLKATKNSDEIKLNVIDKGGKKFVIVPIELIPKIISY